MLRHVVRTLASVATLLALVGCGRLGDVLSPSRGAADARAHVALAARVSLRASAATLTLRARSSYLRADGSLVPIGEQQATLADVPSQQVPLTIELATCVSDASRRGAVAGASAADATCDVVIELTLLSDARVIDQTIIGPLRLTPGGTATPAPVTLVEVSTVTVVPPTGPLPIGGSVGLVVGGTVSLGTTVTATNGDPVNGHAITWTSDAPNIARVDAAGVVTAVAAGRARVTATAGLRSGSVDVIVVPPSATISVGAAGGLGSGTVTSSPAGIDCRIASGRATGTCSGTFPGGTQVTLTAVADPGSIAAPWGGACGAATTTCVLTADAARSATIGFSTLRQITVSGTGGGTGLVTSTPAGISCTITTGSTSGTCTASFRDSATVTLSATPNASQTFVGWGGDCAGTTPTCTLSLSGASRTAVAQFAGPNTLALTLSGNGGGSVTASATGASLGTCTYAAGRQSGTCSSLVAAGSVVTLTAAPDANSTFSGWTGGVCSGAALTCQVTLSQSRTVGAAFAARQISVTVQGTVGSLGDGTVTGTGGLSCAVTAGVASGTCQISITPGTSVTLSATAASSSQFSAWGGACASATGTTCTFTPTTSTTASVAFDRYASVTVSIHAAYYAYGDVDVVAGGVFLGTCSVDANRLNATCGYRVRLGADVSLSANPAAGFSGWSGPCDPARSSFSTCAFTMTNPNGVGAGGSFDALGVRAPSVRAAPNAIQPVTGSGSGSRPSRATPVKPSRE